MTTSTPRADSSPAPRRGPARPLAKSRGRARGFTLTELIIASSLATFVLAGVLSTFLLLGRTGFNASAYAEMNGRLRTAVERFNQDVRNARDLRWQNQHLITLLMPAGAGPDVTYAFEASADPATPGRFLRQLAGSAPEILVREVAPDFTFVRYRLPTSTDEPGPATNDRETALLEVRLRAVRSGASTPTASQLAFSARCVLRNKHENR